MILDPDEPNKIKRSSKYLEGNGDAKVLEVFPYLLLNDGLSSNILKIPVFILISQRIAVYKRGRIEIDVLHGSKS